MSIIVLGSQGMAGHVVTKYLKSQGHDVVTVARKNADVSLDIENFGQVQAFYDNLDSKYTHIINCIGLLVKDSENRPDRAAIINSWFPRYSEQRLRNTNVKLIHLSTDCVFNGVKGYYHEDAIPDEIHPYGRSKSLGEVNNSKDITLRMSIIGPEIKKSGTGLFHWVYHNQNSVIPGWTNAHWNGITTLQLAKCINQYIKESCDISGVYHLVNNRVDIDKYNLLIKINEIFQLDHVIKAEQGPKNVNKILVDTRNLGFFSIPGYDIQLQELRDFMQLG